MEAAALIGLSAVLAQGGLLGAAWWFWLRRRRERPPLDIAQLLRMARSPQDAVAFTDVAGRIVWADTAYAHLTGHGLDDLTRMTLPELLRNAVLPGPRRLELDAALHARTPLRVDVQFRRPGGHARWTMVELHPLRDPEQAEFIGWMVVQIDIDLARGEQERVRQALRDHENLNSIMDQHAIVSETDLQGRILRFNERFTHISGYAQDELLGLNHNLLNSGHHTPDFWRDMWSTIGQGRVWRGEICNRAKNGSLYWVDSVIAPLMGPDGLPERYVSVRTDITARKNHEVLLQRTGRIAGVGGWHGDLGSGVLNFSEEARAILRLDAAQLPVSEVMQGLAPQVAQELRGHVDALVQGRAQVFSQSLKVEQADGSEVWVRLSGEVELYKGKPQRVIGAVQDISSYVLARQRIQAGERLLRSAFEALGEAFAVYDKHERLLFYNDKYREILGAKRSAITTGLTFDTVAQMLIDAGVYRGNTDPRTRLREMRQMMERPDFRYQVQLSTGRWVKYIGHATPDGLHVLFRIDITDIQEALQAAQAAAEGKSRFLANMSHEIRTPMNAVMGMLQLLEQTPLDAEQEDLLGKIGSAARMLLGILNDILDFSKIEAGKMPLDLEPFALDTLYAELSPILSGALGDKSLELIYDIDPAIPLVLRGDMLRLKQVLMNLGGNAIKFTAQGQVLLRVRQMRRDEHGVLLEFAVQDTGIGISPDQIQHIFSGFSQAEASTSRRYGGTGLGLAISQRLVGLMVEASGEGRALTVESEPGRGSCFSFQLCLGVPELGDEALIKSGEEATRIWLLAPATPSRSALSGMLAGQGWQVQVLDDLSVLREAIQHLKAAAAPGAVLLDLDGPDAEAWSRELNAWPKDQVPEPDVLTVSARPRRGGLRKPLTPGMVRAALRRKRAPAQRPPSAPSAKGQRLAGLRLLLVEDNLINQEVARRMLSREGAEIRVAGNGQQALDALNAAPAAYDLVLMDMQMPVLDGLQATRAIRRQGARAQTAPDARPGQAGWLKLPIIAMTANAMVSDRQACLDAGMNDHIGKPFEQELLIQRVLHHVHGVTVSGASSAPLPEPPPSITSAPLSPLDEWPLLDSEGALNRLAADAVFYDRLLQDFSTQAQRLCDDIAQGAEERVRDAAHELKSAARTVGALRLGELAARIERQARQDPRVGAPGQPESHPASPALPAAVTALRAQLALVWTHTAAAQAQWRATQETAASASSPASPQPAPTAQEWLQALDTLACCLRGKDLAALDLADALPVRFASMPVSPAQAASLQEGLRALQEAMAVFDTGRALTAVQALRTVEPMPALYCEFEKTKN
ncbi:PAS domain S-box protein [Hylemonella gracilis]|uniref:Sensory/regulatory protein RpfC n=1 Tax=Hylemonella gracilis ATCC 19624 TaxID=887062 RepID=F3KWW4_9BURK|nr:PAS domain S-box protein [Hylemonella gracilis]EGI75751.1 Proline sensor PrlS [Hylemonella gracilis ATCC 19624]